jgi:hypothetical protein
VLNKTVISQRLLRVLVAAACVVAGALAVCAGPAQAKLIHPYTGHSFGPEGLGPGTFTTRFGGVTGVTVDQSTGDIYVLYQSQTENVIGKFTATGEPANFSSTGTNTLNVSSAELGNLAEIAVDASSGPAAGDIYYENYKNVEIFSSAGVKLGELEPAEPQENPACGIAVDPTGAVYVSNGFEGVTRYVPTANPVTAADATSSLTDPQAEICELGVDAAGNVYADTGVGIRRFTAMEFGALEAQGTLITQQGADHLAVNPANSHVYVDEVQEYHSRVVEYNETGELKSVTADEQLRSEPTSYGVAVGPNGDIYVAGIEGGRVGIFAATTVAVPEASTEAPTSVTNTSATLNGSVNPEGLATTYQFQYGTSTSYGSVTPASPNVVGSDSTSHHLSAELTGLTPGATYHYRIAASNVNGTVYGADQTIYVHAPPTVVGERVAFAYQHSLELVVGIDPHGLDTHYDVEYGPTAEYGSRTASTDLGAGGETSNASPEIKGLELGTTYHYRVVASNADGTVYGTDQVSSTASVATISDETALDLKESSATLSAKAVDYYLASTVHFEYGPTSAYGASTAPVALEAEEYPLTTTASLSGLQVGTTYHYRLVLESEAGIEYGADATFATPSVTAPSTVLPDGRVYERVSSAANADSDVYQDIPHSLEPYEGSSTELPFLVSPDGNAVTYVGGPSELGGIGAEGSDFGNQYLATRDAAGRWSAVNIDPPSSSRVDLPAFNGFSSDLSVGFVSSAANPPLAPGAPGEGYADLYAKTFSTGVYQPLIKGKPGHRAPGEFGTPEMPGFYPAGEFTRIAYAGSSADLTHDLFMVNDALTANAVDGGVNVSNLYDTSGNSTVLVNVLPDGSTEPNATFGGAKLTADEIYNDLYDNYPMFGHDISEDGSRIFWTDLNTGALYVRENDTAPESPLEGGKCTVVADACTLLIAEHAQYWNATPDGSKVLYTKDGDLYEYDVETGEATDLAPNGGVHGVVAASTDLSYVYFVAEGALVPGTESQECEEKRSRRTLCNLYVVHIGEATRFIGALSTSDNFASPETEARYTGDWQGSLADSEAEATPDGAHLLFTSKSSLTGYESDHHGEVFMYDYASGALHCLSCIPSGEQPKPNSLEASAFLPVSDVATTLPHWMSDDGDRVFFDTFDALVPQDTNEQTDVYEWERDGSGTCADSSGCIYLLSDGSSAEGSYLIGASESGDDVFITTRGKLVAEDENENTDVYDIRADAVAPPTPPRCTGSGCQGVPATPPVFATPPSVTYNGVGNFEASVNTVSATPKPKALTRAEKLAKALKACKQKPKKKRRACEAQAKQRYGATKKGKSSSSRRLGNARQSSKGGK